MSSSPRHCPQCEIGHLHSHFRTYVRVESDLLISVPDMLAFQCDVCGYLEYDRTAYLSLESLLGASLSSGSRGSFTSRAAPEMGEGSTPHPIDP